MISADEAIAKFNAEHKLFAMLIGRSGSGKSAAAASMPKPFLELDFDLRSNGIVNAIRQGWLKGEIGKDINFKQFNPFGGYLQIQDYLNSQYNLILANQFRWTTVDLGSLFSMLRLLEITSLNAVDKDNKNNHLNISGLTMTGPADYKFETQATCKIMDFLRIMPCHVTVAGHIVEKYGKLPGDPQYAPSRAIGEKLTITANLGESILAMFNDVYKFTKVVDNNTESYYVEFSTDIAKNSFGIPPGKFPITKKEFWPFFCQLVNDIKKGSFKHEEAVVSGGMIL